MSGGDPSLIDASTCDPSTLSVFWKWGRDGGIEIWLISFRFSCWRFVEAKEIEESGDLSSRGPSSLRGYTFSLHESSPRARAKSVSPERKTIRLGESLIGA